MDFDEFEKNNGGKPRETKSDSRLPEHYRKSHDGHLGGTELDWDEIYGGNVIRDHFGFRINRNVL